jgi:hypothetical protein
VPSSPLKFIDPVVRTGNTFLFKQLLLRRSPAVIPSSQPAETIHYSVPRQVLITVMCDPANRSGGISLTGTRCQVSVRRDTT